MGNVVVIYKQDGTIQCADIPPRPLEFDEKALRTAGVKTICGKANVPGPIIYAQLCGLPTGRVNAFAISEQDWTLLKTGIIGTLGFHEWSGAPLPKLGLPADCALVGGTHRKSVGWSPIFIRELYGRPVRCYQTGEVITEDYVPERVNIEHNAERRIVDVWFG